MAHRAAPDVTHQLLKRSTGDACEGLQEPSHFATHNAAGVAHMSVPSHASTPEQIPRLHLSHQDASAPISSPKPSRNHAKPRPWRHTASSLPPALVRPIAAANQRSTNSASITQQVRLQHLNHTSTLQPQSISILQNPKPLKPTLKP
jgi:hypothetical protein